MRMSSLLLGGLAFGGAGANERQIKILLGGALLIIPGELAS